MEASERFINWLEGYLDASKNKIGPGQVREIRKKIAEYHKACSQNLIPLWDSATGIFTPNTKSNNSMLNEEFLKEVEKAKSASTMEELHA